MRLGARTTVRRPDSGTHGGSAASADAVVVLGAAPPAVAAGAAEVASAFAAFAASAVSAPVVVVVLVVLVVLVASASHATLSLRRAQPAPSTSAAESTTVRCELIAP